MESDLHLLQASPAPTSTKHDLRYQDVSSSSYYEQNMSDDTWHESENSRGWSKSGRSSLTSLSSGATESQPSHNPRKAIKPTSRGKRRHGRKMRHASRIDSDQRLDEEDEEEWNQRQLAAEEHCSCGGSSPGMQELDSADCGCSCERDHHGKSSCSACNTCTDEEPLCSCGKMTNNFSAPPPPPHCSCNRPLQSYSEGRQSEDGMLNLNSSRAHGHSSHEHQNQHQQQHQQQYHYHHGQRWPQSPIREIPVAMRTMSTPCPTLTRFRSQPNLHTDAFYEGMQQVYPQGPYSHVPRLRTHYPLYDYGGLSSQPTQHCACPECLAKTNNQSMHTRPHSKPTFSPHSTKQHVPNVHPAYGPPQPLSSCTCHACSAGTSQPPNQLPSFQPAAPLHPQSFLQSQPFPSSHHLTRHRSDGDILRTSRAAQHYPAHMDYHYLRPQPQAAMPNVPAHGQQAGAAMAHHMPHRTPPPQPPLGQVPNVYDSNYCGGCADDDDDNDGQHASWCPGDYENFQKPIAPSVSTMIM